MSNNPPNILLLTIDCWRADYFGTNGSGSSPTPNMDRLAEEAVAFHQAITCGGWTRPSITALFSSTFASMYNGPLGRYSQERPIVSELLQQLGYETGGFTTNPQIGRLFGFERGFDTFIECEPDGNLPGPRWAKIKGAKRLLCQPFTHWLMKPFGVNTLPEEVTMPAEQLVERMIAWLDKAHDKPVFAWAHFMDAHWPYHILRRSYFHQDKAQIWRDLQTIHQVTAGHGYFYPGDEAVRRLRRLYKEALSYVDEYIGRLIRHLRSNGQWDNTVLIITSDHGEEFYEHGRWSHYQLFDESVHIPLVLRVPGLAPNRKIYRQVSLLDIAPTILELAGGQKPAAMLGTSLLPVADNHQVPYEEAYAEAMWPDNYRLAIRNESYKYIYDNQRSEDILLFDLERDPKEQHNIYPVHQPVARHFDELRRAHEDRARSTAGTAEAAEVDPQLAERLRALGYLE